MLTARYGGRDGHELEFDDHGDLVVIRSKRRGARHDQSPLSRQTRAAQSKLEPLFGVAAAGVGVYKAPEGTSEELATIIDADPEIEFAGRGLRDAHHQPVVYTENLFVKFADDADPGECEAILAGYGLSLKRPLEYATNAYFVEAPKRTGRTVFDIADKLFGHDEVELCHPEIVREKGLNGAFPQQWHLQTEDIGGTSVAQSANVVAAWEITQGDGVVVAIIDDGVDIDHEEFASAGKIVAPQSVSPPKGDDPRPGDGENHGTCVAGVAVADGLHGASGVAPKARLLPIRSAGALGSQDEADAFVWAANSGAAVINCSWGPADGVWWEPDDPDHNAVAPLPDSSRLAIDFALTQGRGGLGCVICWAAGNGNESVDNDGYASNPKVIAVAACNDIGTRSAYSDKGKALWCAFPSSNFQLVETDVVLTPGIWTTDRMGREGENSGAETMGDLAGNYFSSFGGTSSASPGVAGVAALVIAANPKLTGEEVKDILKGCCDRIDDHAGEYDAAGHSTNYGFGRINARKAVELAQAAVA
jgi:subtilisin family serine protease